MLADATKLGQVFYKLVQAKYTPLCEDIMNYDGDDTSLLEHYVVDVDAEDYDYVSCEASELGTVELVQVETVTVVGERTGGIRCYTDKITAYKDAKGTLWMDAELHDEIFC
jgi:hypothetical protein